MIWHLHVANFGPSKMVSMCKPDRGWHFKFRAYAFPAAERSKKASGHGSR